MTKSTALSHHHHHACPQKQQQQQQRKNMEVQHVHYFEYNNFVILTVVYSALLDTL
jgi:hypothetical protein